MSTEYFDLVIVGAGLSGIGAGVHFENRCAGKSYVILEARAQMGGTWDLFRYPGIRSDSDMHTLGFDFEQDEPVSKHRADIGPAPADDKLVYHARARRVAVKERYESVADLVLSG